MNNNIDNKNDNNIIDFEPAFESARGMEWLDAFYLKNEKELQKYF